MWKCVRDIKTYIYEKKTQQNDWGKIVMKLISNEKNLEPNHNFSINKTQQQQEKNKAKNNNGISFIYLLNNLFIVQESVYRFIFISIRFAFFSSLHFFERKKQKNIWFRCFFFLVFIFPIPSMVCLQFDLMILLTSRCYAMYWCACWF